MRVAIAVAIAVVFVVVLGLAVASPAPSAATSLDATAATFEFGVTGQTVTNPANLSRALPAGTSLTYGGVATLSGTPLDAVVTFVGGTNLRGSSDDSCNPGCMRRLDRIPEDPDSDRYLEQSINRATSGSGAMAEVRVDFFVAGTSTPATLSNLVMHVYDIDNSQGLEVDGMTSYSVATNTHLTTIAQSGGAVRFVAPPSSTTEAAPTLSAYTVGRVTARFASASSITYRLLAPDSVSSPSFSVDFSLGVAWTDNVGGSEVVTLAPSSLSPSTQTVNGVVNCPITTATPLASNFGGTVTYASTSGTTPAGITLNTATGVFSGSIAAAGINAVSLSASGSVSGSATAAVTFNITDSAMTLAPVTQSVSGTSGTAITATSALAATSPCSSVSYSLTSGTLPAGLSLNASTGAITGTPTEGSTATVTITATDTIGRTATSTVTFDIPTPGSAQVLPPAVSDLVVQPIPTAPSPTTPSTTLPPTTPPVTTAPPAPAPVPTPSGGLPALGDAETLVTENGQPVAVELVVENDEALVLRSEDFELRLRGACTTGCTITQDTTGRETIHLDRTGGARVSGFGFLPGSLVHVWIFSEPRYLGALLVAADGTYEGTFPLTDIDVGGHTLQANGTSFDNVPRSANLGIIVIDNTAAPTPAPTALPATGGTNNGTLWAATLIAAGIALIAPARRRRTIVD